MPSGLASMALISNQRDRRLQLTIYLSSIAGHTTSALEGDS